MCGTDTSRITTLAEALAFSAFIALYIWRLQFSHPQSWLIFLAWLVVSLVVHRDTPKTMGWRADNLWPATRQAIPVFGVCIAALLCAGLYLGAMHRMPAHFLDRHRFLGYFSFCLLQQVALNSYLMNRLLSAVKTPWPAAALASVLFALLHWPNPVLVPLTLLGGFVMCWLFARERNILPLTLGQAVLGGLVWWAFPIAWHHSMRVGPGYHAFGNRLW
ncbi:MAG TPA: CPBP family intramembrane glutamic endopeptidase [Candidatus Acidoferrum sp.]|nr:CPBP family intramembrane glutamic endopeptidase [Candidatus Acidoferrum sp.]